MKLALVLLVLATAFVASEACQRRCFYIYRIYRICNKATGICTYIRIRYLYCYCAGKRSVESNVEVGFPCNFTKYDTNGDGGIDKKEFLAAIKVPDSKTVHEIFKKWDKNGDGKIDCSEFMAVDDKFECPRKGCESADQNEADEEFWDTK